MQLFLPFKTDNYKPSKTVYFQYVPVKRPRSLKRYPARGNNKPKGLVIYFLFNKGELIYSGKSNNLSRRFRRHRLNGKVFDQFSYTKVAPKYEKLLIKTFKPTLNKYSKA